MARGRHRAEQPRGSRPSWQLPAAIVSVLALVGGTLLIVTARDRGSALSPLAAVAPTTPTATGTPRTPATVPSSPATSPSPPAPAAPTTTAPVPPPPPAVTAGVETLTWGGLTRRAVTSRPPAQRGPLPLVLMLHGRASNPHGEQRRTHLDDLAARGEAVVVYPEAVGPSWNAGSCCERASADDSGFVAALAARLVAQGVADPARIYAVGFSTGGMMAYRLACDHPDLLAGVGSVGGVLVAPCPDTLRVPLVQVHSRQDPEVPLRGTTSSGLSGGPLPGVGDIVEGWRKRTGCTGRLYATEVTRSGAAEVRDIKGCPPGGAVLLLLTDERAHRWSQAADGLDASAVLWTFLRGQRRA